MSQQQLADRLGPSASQPQVSRWENGGETPTVATLARIARALEVRLQPETLQQARVISGLSQQQVASALGVARPTVAAWERDRSPLPEAYVEAVARLYRVHPLQIRALLVRPRLRRQGLM